MKEVYRKPALPALFGILLGGGMLFLLFLLTSLGRNREAVERMYQDTRVLFRVLPGTAVTEGMTVSLNKGEQILETGLAERFYGEMQCQAMVGAENRGLIGFQTVYGTNNPESFAENRQLQISYGAGYDASVFQLSGNLCLLEEKTARENALEIGDRVMLVPCIAEYVIEEEAPTLEFILAGTYESGEMGMIGNAVVMPLKAFFREKEIPVLQFAESTAINGGNSSAPIVDLRRALWHSDRERWETLGGLIYSKEMAKRFKSFTEFSFVLKAEYNRSCEKVSEELQRLLGSTMNYLVYSDARTLENAVQPLERRLEMTETVLPLLKGVLVLICGLLCVLMTKLRQNNLLIRRVYGESLLAAMGKEWLGILAGMAPGFVVSGVLTGGYGVRNRWGIGSSLTAVSDSKGLSSASGVSGLWSLLLVILILCMILPFVIWLFTGRSLLGMYQTYNKGGE